MATRRWNNETEVNAVTAGFQEDARVAALAGGGFVVAWRNASGVGASGISARIFDTLGRPVSTELAVATGSASTFHDAPDVAALPDGGFQVVWTTTAIAENGAVTGSNVVGRVFTASGAPVRDITVTEVQAGRFDDSVAIAPFGPNLALVFQTTAGDGPLLRVLDPTGAGGPPIPSGFVARAWRWRGRTPPSTRCGCSCTATPACPSANRSRWPSRMPNPCRASRRSPGSPRGCSPWPGRATASTASCSAT
jgi:hypothetical protein